MYPVNTNKLTVTSKFGPRTYTYQGKQVSDYHKGIDLIGGSEIVAFAYGVVTFESGSTGHFSAGRENTAYVGSGSARHWTSLTYAFGANSPTAIDHRQPYITVYMWKRTA